MWPQGSRAARSSDRFVARYEAAQSGTVLLGARRSRYENWRRGAAAWRTIRTSANEHSESAEFGTCAGIRGSRGAPCVVGAPPSKDDFCKQTAPLDDQVVEERLFAAVSSARFVTEWSPAIVAV